MCCMRGTGQQGRRAKEWGGAGLVGGMITDHAGRADSIAGQWSDGAAKPGITRQKEEGRRPSGMQKMHGTWATGRGAAARRP